MAAGVARLTQTITIVDKSNKVVGASKQLKDVFQEAKIAYLERRAEIKAERKRKEERELQKAIRTMSIADEDERRSDVSRSKTHRESKKGRRKRRNSDERSRYLQDESSRSRGSPRDQSPRGTPAPMNLAQFNQKLYGQSRSVPVSPVDSASPHPDQMIRRSRTELDIVHRPRLSRSLTAPDVDLDLAYGEFHDGDLRSLSRTAQAQEPTPQSQQKELGSLVQRCQLLLDEANCAQHSARKMVAHLQANPDSMAAVALTLAEISSVASKMAPGALAVFKTSAPAVMALLASPQFLIAVGVGIGVTVVMFGGYKIVKKIKAHTSGLSSSQENLRDGVDGGQLRNATSIDEALDVRELDRIENWRRGIADAQAASIVMDDDDRRTEASGYSAATSVEGEFITPYAAQSMGHLPLPRKIRGDRKEKKEKKEREKEKDKAEAKDKDKDRKEKKEKRSSRRRRDGEDVQDETSSVGDSDVTTDTAQSESRRSERDRQLIKVKKPSPLRKMFVSGSSVKA